MAASLTIDLAAGASSLLATRKVQTIVDGAVAPSLDTLAVESGGTVTVSFSDAVASEQVLACFKALVNEAGLAESGLAPATIDLTGDVTPGSLQREYSV